MARAVAIIGAAGLTGKELLLWFGRHPEVVPVHITSDQNAGQTLREVFPALDGLPFADLEFKKHSDPLPSEALVFLAVPNDTSLALVPQLRGAGHSIVDLSGSFRLSDTARFKRYYGLDHDAPAELKERVFGIPEIFRERIRSAQFVSNPGCYATGAIVPLHLLGELRAEIDFVSVDAKSGVSGAGGRVEGAGFAFTGVNENFRAYKVQKHQHQPEIEEFSFFGMETPPPDLVFVPHLLPVYRGILSTITIRWKDRAPADLAERFRAVCADEPFLRFYDQPEAVELLKVQNTNFLDFGLCSEGRTTVIVSALDNLLKGAAGQAIQNMNLLLGLPETTGLIADPPAQGTAATTAASTMAG